MIKEEKLLEIAQRYGAKVNDVASGEGGFKLVKDGIKRSVIEEDVAYMFSFGCVENDIKISAENACEGSIKEYVTARLQILAA